LLVLTLRAASSLRYKAWTRFLSEQKAILAGILPVLAILAYFKLAVAPAQYLVSKYTFAPMRDALDPGTIAHRLTQGWRYGLIAKSMASQILRFGSRTIGITLFLALYFFAVRAKRSSSSNVQLGVVLLLLMLAGYFAVYLTTPLNLAFQLSTSLSRLLLQLWPGGVFLFFMAASAPGELTLGVK
jgi:hypothetical protein